jgi:hypothetical protein
MGKEGDVMRMHRVAVVCTWCFTGTYSAGMSMRTSYSWSMPCVLSSFNVLGPFLFSFDFGNEQW